MTPTPIDPTPPFLATPVPPELLAWVGQTSDAFAAEMRAVEASGGVPF